MTFDDQLRRAFDTLTDRLRDDLARQVQGVVDELAASAQAERERVAAAAKESGHVEGRETGRQHGLEQGREEGREEGREQGREKGREEGRRLAEQAARDMIESAVASARADTRSTDAASTDRLVEAIRAIGRARSLSEILDTLISRAGREATRAAVLLVRGGQLHGWRFTGFDPAPESDQPIELSLAHAGVVGEAVRANALAIGDGALIGVPTFAGPPADRPCMAAPIALCGQVVAVLYVDGESTTPPPSPIPNHFIEVLASHAARCLEAMTAFKAARALTTRPEARVPPAANEAQETAAEGDAAARRYARLLVSEIKLYHETAVVDGRRERDLATRLGGEIARARVLYEQRVPPQVRQHTDYFHDEVVRTLANGDAGLLEG